MRSPKNNTLFVGKVVRRFASLPSTNQYARERLANSEPAEGTAILADAQTAGRGQYGRSWQSEPAQNLLLSVLFYPHFLPPREQFRLSQAMALAVAACVSAQGLEPVRVKWPNDIYLGPHKVAGLLIQNQISAGQLANSVVGIGLNVNQTQFPAELPNPTSLAAAAGAPLDREAVLQQLFHQLEQAYLQLRQGKPDYPGTAYRERLYGLEEDRWFTRADGSRFRGAIKGVAPGGKLRIEAHDGTVELFAPKAISFR